MGRLLRQLGRSVWKGQVAERVGKIGRHWAPDVQRLEVCGLDQHALSSSGVITLNHDVAVRLTEDLGELGLRPSEYSCVSPVGVPAS